ncbi:MAG TPA: threonine synthase [Candidatus Saccharimonadia bacterium]|nr:threonine synthase [Candidatus Saccharimonadia bacterium]
MKFYALGNPRDSATFREAVERGLAKNGSLYFPTRIPKLSRPQLESLVDATPSEVAYVLLSAWLGDELAEANLRSIIAQACTFEVPVVQVGPKEVLEVFHGPTAAFKDVAARYLAAFMGFYGAENGHTSIVLVATSGDTGGAIAQGFAGIPDTHVVVLFPRGRVSQLQREQLTRVAANITSLEVEGSFDDCQDLVKRALNDPSLSQLHLTTANSISIGRLLPQITYYVTGSLAAGGLHRPLRFVVPSGNLGNLTAGTLARAMGAPITSFLAANNANNLLHRYLQSPEAGTRPVQATFANAMDVGRPGNLPRLAQVFGDHHSQLTAAVTGATITDAEIIATIQKVWTEHHYLLDPHTAVAWAASDAHPAAAATDVIVATAAPQKFASEIEALCGIPVDNTQLLQQLQHIPVRFQAMPNSYQALLDVLASVSPHAPSTL